MSSLPAIILAAGMSQRMGTCKQTLLFDGKPLLAHLLEVLQSVAEVSPVFVVTGRYWEEIAPILEAYKAVVVHNSDYEAGGMLSSIQTGVAALPTNCQGFLLLLGDQPFVTSKVLKALIEAQKSSEASIVQTAYEGKRGHPILFRASCIPEILALPPDATLKTLMTRHAEDTLAVPVSRPTILADIDTPAEYAEATRLFATGGAGRANLPCE